MDERLAKRRHDISWVVQGEASNEADCGLTVLKDLIVECYEKRADVLCLCEVLVELFVQVR